MRYTLLALVACGSSAPPPIASTITYQVDGDVAGVASAMQTRLDLLAIAGHAHADSGNVIVTLPALDPRRAAQVRRTLARSGVLAVHEVIASDDVMQRLAQRALTDPAAASAGIALEPDTWRNAVHLTAPDRGDATGRHALGGWLAAQYGAIPVPADRQILFEHDGAVWRTYYVDRAAILDGARVRATHADAHAVELALDDDGAQAFTRWTAAHVGAEVAIVIDDRVVAAPIIDDAVTSDRLEVPTADDDDPVELATAIAAPLPGPVVTLSDR